MAALTQEQKAAMRVITPEAILSYPWLFKAQPPMPNADGSPGQGEPRFGATLVFVAGTDLSALKAAAKAAGEAKFGPKFLDGVRSGKYKWPFRQDEEKGYPEGATFIGARAKTQPGMVSRYIDPTTQKAAIITEASQKAGHRDELYAGCKVRASVVAYGFDKNGGKGVAFALNNIQKLGDGPRLDNRKAADQEFEADLAAPVADISDVAHVAGTTTEDDSDPMA